MKILNTSPQMLLSYARQLQPELVKWRRRFHSEPELAFEEFNTSAFIAQELTDLGYTVRSGLARTGLVADLGHGLRVGIRAEMDAVPMTEMAVSPYISKTPGAMHSCGHDANMACALGAARILAAVEGLPGAVRFVFQPASEPACDEGGKTGTYRMIEAGALTALDCIIAMHVDSTIATGKVALVSVPSRAWADGFTITVRKLSDIDDGRLDVTVLGSGLVVALLRESGNVRAALNAAKLRVTGIQSFSSSADALPDGIQITGSFEANTAAARRSIISEIESCCEELREAGADYSVSYAETADPQDSAAVADCAQEAITEVLGQANVQVLRRQTWMEDFASFTRVVPGAFMLLGAEVAGSRRIHHSPTFDLNEESLAIGAAALAGAALGLMQRNS